MRIAFPFATLPGSNISPRICPREDRHRTWLLGRGSMAFLTSGMARSRDVDVGGAHAAAPNGDHRPRSTGKEGGRRLSPSSRIVQSRHGRNEVHPRRHTPHSGCAQNAAVDRMEVIYGKGSVGMNVPTSIRRWPSARGVSTAKAPLEVSTLLGSRKSPVLKYEAAGSGGSLL